MVWKIISGAQTGVDRAALDAAMSLGIATGGWVPAGRLAEDGVIPVRYETLVETGSSDYEVRTVRNVRDADATLILNVDALTGGTLFTQEVAMQQSKPCLVVQLDGAPSVAGIGDWLNEIQPDVLNVAGPRESGRPGVHDQAYHFILQLCEWLSEHRSTE